MDFEDVGDNWRRVDERGLRPVVAIPTTAGTGAEVGRAAVITDSERRLKRLIFHPKMMPGRVIADPELTVGMPRSLTVYTGFDAMAHSLEAFCAPGFHPMADGVALEALRLIRPTTRNACRQDKKGAAHANTGSPFLSSRPNLSGVVERKDTFRGGLQHKGTLLELFEVSFSCLVGELVEP